MEPSGIERRGAARAAIDDVPAAVLVGGHDLGLHVIVDASATGVFVRHASPVLPAGTLIELVLPSPAGRSALKLAGCVARVVPSGAGSGYGVALIEPPADVVRQIGSLRIAKPRAESKTAAPKRAPSSSTGVPQPPPPTGDVRVLVVDHDGLHGNEVVRVLGHMGLHAVLETNAARATDTFQLRRRSLSIAIVDLLLPDVSGEAMIARLRNEKPGLTIIATTSVLKTVSSQKPLIRAGANRVLTKPITPQGLADAVRELLTPT